MTSARPSRCCLLDRLHDRDQQALAAAEVVDQHPVARPDRRGQLTQRQIGDPARGDVVDHRLQKFFARHGEKCTMWYIMPAPVTVSVDVPQRRADVYAFLDVMANHESFTDHMLTDWHCSGPATGLGAKADVKVKAGGRSEHVRFEVVEVEEDRMIRERNWASKGKRVATGTYALSDNRGRRHPRRVHLRVRAGARAREAARPAHAPHDPQRQRALDAAPRRAARRFSRCTPAGRAGSGAAPATPPA